MGCPALPNARGALHLGHEGVELSVGANSWLVSKAVPCLRGNVAINRFRKMKRHIALAFYLMLAAGVSAAPRASTLTFRNGDKLTGSMTGYNASKGFLWQHPAIAGPMHVEASSVSKISLSAGCIQQEKAGRLLPRPSVATLAG